MVMYYIQLMLIQCTDHECNADGNITMVMGGIAMPLCGVAYVVLLWPMWCCSGLCGVALAYVVLLWPM